MSEPDTIVVARRALGRLLADHRSASGQTQHRLAAAVAYSRTTLANVEVGRQYAGRDFWQRVDAALNASGVLLAAFDDLHRQTMARRAEQAEAGRQRRPGGPGAKDRDVERREFLRAVAMASAAAAVPVGGAVAATAQSLDEHAEMNAHLWRVFAIAHSKQAALPLVTDQLEVLTRQLDVSPLTASRARLCGLVGDLCQLAGEIHFDGGRLGDAAQAYTLAATASRDAGNQDMWAAAMVRHAYLSLYERPDQAAAMLDLAGRLADRGDASLSTRYWVASVQAQACAELGDLAGCRRALDQAEQVGDALSPGGWLRFDASRLPEERGACFVRLHRPALAEAALSAALRPDISARRRGAVLADLAAVGVQRGDIDQVVSCTGQAVAVARQTASGWVGQKLTGLRRQLVPMLDDGRIRDLYDQMR